MNLPRNNSQLKKLFRNARAPKITEFDGEYSVDMLTVLPSLKKFSHRKIFYKEDNRILGYNKLFANKIWGRFFLEEGIYEEKDSLKVIVINYDRAENSFISNRIRDQIRCIKDNELYLGRFNIKFMGKLHFSGYFSLSKM